MRERNWILVRQRERRKKDRRKRRKARKRERERERERLAECAEKVVISSRSLVVSTELIKAEAWQSTYKISRNVDGYGEGFYYFCYSIDHARCA